MTRTWLFRFGGMKEKDSMIFTRSDKSWSRYVAALRYAAFFGMRIS